MRKTKQRIFKYKGERVYVTGKIETNDQGQIIGTYPAFIPFGDGFTSLTQLEEFGEEIGKKK
jgi:hypothetical protein